MATAQELAALYRDRFIQAQQALGASAAQIQQMIEAIYQSALFNYTNMSPAEAQQQFNVDMGSLEQGLRASNKQIPWQAATQPTPQQPQVLPQVQQPVQTTTQQPVQQPRQAPPMYQTPERASGRTVSDRVYQQAYQALLAQGKDPQHAAALATSIGSTVPNDAGQWSAAISDADYQANYSDYVNQALAREDAWNASMLDIGGGDFIHITPNWKPAANSSLGQSAAASSVGAGSAGVATNTAAPVTSQEAQTINVGDPFKMGGKDFTLAGRNADGTVNLKASDGTVFNGVTRQEIAELAPKKPWLADALAGSAAGTAPATGSAPATGAAPAQYAFSAPKVASLIPEQAAKYFRTAHDDDPFGKLPPDLKKQADAWVQANQDKLTDPSAGMGDGGASPQPWYTNPKNLVKVLNGIGLSNNDIAALGVEYRNKQAPDPKVRDEAAIANLVKQLNPQAYAGVAAQNRQKPEELTRQMAADLARYGISDLSQVGATKVGGRDIYFNRQTGEVIPSRFGSDMSGKGGKYFSFATAENGVVVPVPSWTDTSDKESIKGFLSVAAMVGAPYAYGYLSGPVAAGGMGLSGAASGAIVGGTSGAIMGAPDGLKGAVKGGLTGAALGAAGGAIGDYVKGAGALPGADPNTDWSAFTSRGMSSEDVANIIMRGEVSEAGLTSLLNSGYTPAQLVQMANTGGPAAFETALSGNTGWDSLKKQTGYTSEEIAKATMHGDMSEAQIADLHARGFTGPQIATLAENGQTYESIIQNGNAPQGSKPTTGTTTPDGGSGKPSTLKDWINNPGGALSNTVNNLTPRDLIGGGMVVGGVIGGGNVNQPGSPNIENPGGGLPGTGGGSVGSGGSNADAIASMRGVVARDQQIRDQSAAQVQPYLTDWLNAGRKASQEQAALAGQQRTLATQQASDYTNTFAPVAREMAKEAMAYGRTEDQERQARKASQSVNEQTAAAVDAANQQLQDMGINPNSGRFLGANLGARIKGAAAAAGAGNEARTNAKKEGIALRTGASNFGLNLNQQAQAGLSSSADMQSKAASSQQSSVAGALSTGDFKAGNPATYMAPDDMQVKSNLGLAGLAMDKYRADKGAAAGESAGWGNLIGTGLGLLFGR